MLLKIVLNYLILLIYGGVVGLYNIGDGVFYFILPVLLIFLSLFNCYHCNKWQTVLILHIHLLIATIFCVSLEGYLYCNYVSDDAETHMLIMFMFMVGTAMVAGLGAIATWIRYSQTKKQENSIQKS